VISAAARALVRRRVEAQMTARITILRGGRGTLDPATGLVGGLANAQTVYTGKARIRTVSGAGVLAIGEDQIDTRQTLISIPIDSPVPRCDDLVRVEEDGTADPDLGGRLFRVTEVEGGSLFGDACRMAATSFYDSSRWSRA